MGESGFQYSLEIYQWVMQPKDTKSRTVGTVGTKDTKSTDWGFFEVKIASKHHQKTNLKFSI